MIPKHQMTLKCHRNYRKITPGQITFNDHQIIPNFLWLTSFIVPPYRGGPLYLLGAIAIIVAAISVHQLLSAVYPGRYNN